MEKPKEKKKKNAVVLTKDEKKKKKSPTDCIEFPENIPKEVQQTIMAMSSSQQMGGTRSHPLFDKFTDDHVHKYLDYIQKDDDNEFGIRRSNRWFYLLYAILGIGLFLFLVVYLLPKDKIVFDQIIKMFVAFAGGFGGGYGLKAYRDMKK